MIVWLQALLLTLAVEVPLAVILLREHPPARVAAVAAIATVLSHPLLWFVLLPSLPGPFLAAVLAGELVVIVLEAGVYRRGLRPIGAGRALAASASLNAASYLTGLLLFNAA